MGVTPAAVAQWASGKTRPGRRRRDDLWRQIGIPPEAWEIEAEEVRRNQDRTWAVADAVGAGRTTAGSKAHSVATGSPTEPNEQPLADRSSNELAKLEQQITTVTHQISSLQTALIGRCDRTDREAKTLAGNIDGVTEALETLALRLDATWYEVTTDDGIARLTPPNRTHTQAKPNTLAEIHRVMTQRAYDTKANRSRKLRLPRARLRSEARAAIGPRYGDRAAILMETLMLYIDLQQEPEAADYVAVFAVEQRGGSFEYFTGCSQLFAKLVHQRPGIARTGLSFYRAVLEEEFDRLP